MACLVDEKPWRKNTILSYLLNMPRILFYFYINQIKDLINIKMTKDSKKEKRKGFTILFLFVILILPRI